MLRFDEYQREVNLNRKLTQLSLAICTVFLIFSAIREGETDYSTARLLRSDRENSNGMTGRRAAFDIPNQWHEWSK